VQRAVGRGGKRDGDLEADEMRLHVADLGNDTLMTTGHVSQL